MVGGGAGGGAGGGGTEAVGAPSPASVSADAPAELPKLGIKMGHGSFGAVWRAEAAGGGGAVAVKIVALQGGPSELQVTCPRSIPLHTATYRQMP